MRKTAHVEFLTEVRLYFGCAWMVGKQSMIIQTSVSRWQIETIYLSWLICSKEGILSTNLIFFCEFIEDKKCVALEVDYSKPAEF